jgi:hypothetical protein
MSNLDRELSINASYRVSVASMLISIQLFSSPCQRQRELLPSPGICCHITFHILIFSSETPQPNELKRGRKHLCGSFGQAVSEEKILKNRPIRNINCLWQPCLLMDRDKMSKLYKGPSIDASYHVSVHLAEGFYQDCSFCLDWLTNMATTGNSCF